MRQFCEVFIVLLFGVAASFGVTPESNRSMALQTEPEPDMDISRIKRVSERLYLDISVIMTYEALYALRYLNIDPEKLLYDVFKRVAQIYAWHNIMVAVREVEYWSSGNKVIIPHPTQLDHLASFFNSRPKVYDSHLVFHEFQVNNNVGFAFVNKLCTSMAIAMIKTSSFANISNTLADTVAHELGHTIGFPHSNDIHKCLCLHNDKKYCIMNSVNSERNTKTPKSLENCNIDRVTRSLSRLTCLLKPMNEDRYFKSCGDGIIDPGEDCDCGFYELCHQITDHGKYCNMNQCKFSKGDCQCVTGECCENCKYVFGKICRGSHGECDVEERCDGKQKDCPKDVVVKNFALCDKDAGICYDGTCTNFNSLCKYVYKKESVRFTQTCVDNFIEMINQQCPHYGHYSHYDLVCNQFPNICQNFVCSTDDYSIKYITMHTLRNENCFVPSNEIREGVLKLAPNYMKCGHDAYCFNGQCLTNNSLLKNCKNGKCTSINNRRTVTDYKSLDLLPEVHNFRLFGYEEFVDETSSKEVVTISKNYKPLAWIAAAPIAVIVVVFGFIWWKRTPRKDDDH